MNRLLFTLVLLAVVASAACQSFSPAEGSSPAEKVYNRSCIVCHGKTGGGADGPNLLERALTKPGIEAQIKAGGNGMPSYTGRLSDDEIRQAADWVVELRKRAGRETPAA